MQRTSVAVIGAGMSGVSCAYTLCKQLRHTNVPVDVVILEARDRIGGRTHSITVENDTNSAVADLGASWIEGELGNPINKIIKKFGIKTSDGHAYMNVNTVFDYDGSRIDEDELDSIGRRLQLIMDDALSEQDDLDEEDDVSIWQRISHEISEQFKTERDIRICEYLISSLEQYDGASFERLSLRLFHRNLTFGGRTPYVADGYGNLCKRLYEAISAKLPSHLSFEAKLGSIVENIDCTPTDGVTITVKSNTTDQTTNLHFDYVICTIPLGVLKAKHEQLFTPPLSQEKQESIERIGFGLMNKIVLQFPQVFWDIEDGQIGHISTLKNRFRFILNLRYYNRNSPPVLIFFTTCDFAEQLEKEFVQDEQVVNECMNLLRVFYGSQVLEPVRSVVTRWNTDPFALGSYSYLSVGCSMNDFATLSEPEFDERLGFAGEATSEYFSTVHGAYMSGEREGKRLAKLIKKK
jgi:monoamine oxidase